MPTKNVKRIAVLADAHANWPALQAVMNDVHRKKADEIWYLGDFIGYGPYPQKVVQCLKKNADHCIVGNYDLNVLKFTDKKKRWKHSKDPSKFFSYAWTSKNIEKDESEYLAGLKESVTVDAFGKRFMLVHGSPESIDEPLKADTPRERFMEIAQTVDADIILCGHTHVYFSKKVGSKHFVNPGSVGRPFDHNPNPSYVLLEQLGTKINVRNIRVSYNVKSVVQKMKREGFPKDICDSIELGQSLDAIKDKNNKYSSEDEVIKEVLKLARSCEYEKAHSHQVTKLALKLFDELKNLHKLGKRHKLLLQSASLLHDIGWIKGRVRHHKTSRDIILKSFNLPLTKEEKLIVAMVARYHRRALPRSSHKYYSSLNPAKQTEMKKLAAILRVADGLDRTHVSVVKDLECSLKNGNIVIEVVSDNDPECEKSAALKKSDLFTEVFGLDIKIKWNKDK